MDSKAHGGFALFDVKICDTSACMVVCRGASATSDLTPNCPT